MDKLKQWLALTVVGCLALMAAGWFLLISPKKAETADVRTQAEEQEDANTVLRTKLTVLKAQAKELPKKQADLARVAAKIPDNPAMPALIRALTAASTSAGVELLSVTPGEPAAAAAEPVPGAAPVAPPAQAGAAAPTAAPAPPGGVLAVIPVELQVVGGYFEVAQFLANIEDLPRAMRVTNLTLTPGAAPPPGGGAPPAVEDGRSLVSTITGSVYMAANRPAVAPVTVPAK